MATFVESTAEKLVLFFFPRFIECCHVQCETKKKCLEITEVRAVSCPSLQLSITAYHNHMCQADLAVMRKGSMLAAKRTPMVVVIMKTGPGVY